MFCQFTWYTHQPCCNFEKETKRIAVKLPDFPKWVNCLCRISFIYNTFDGTYAIIQNNYVGLCSFYEFPWELALKQGANLKPNLRREFDRRAGAQQHDSVLQLHDPGI